MATIQITDNEFLRQFETLIDGEKVTLEYVDQERKIFLTKLNMSETLRAQNYQDDFLHEIFQLLRTRKTRIVPTSRDVAKFFKAHKQQYKDLLPIGISI